jgi:DNA-binding NarL/FixJ family response regulator
MAATIRELRDPAGWALAILALIANLLLKAGPLRAVIVAIVVLAVKLGAGMLWPRPKPVAPVVEPPLRRGPRVPGAMLTAREMEVAALVTEGLTNRQIGLRLRPQVQETGVDHHVLNIMNKLSVHSRAEIAAWYTRQKAAGKA